jgi:hypothetical protein
MNTVTANGQPIAAKLPCTIEEFLRAQDLLPLEHKLARPRGQS